MCLCSPGDLAGIPIVAAGYWGQMSADENALPVLERMRTAALANVKLLSDRQPPKLVVEGDPHNPNLPLVDVRHREDGAAWIWLDVDGPMYNRLCYQFGHELGHVLCNRWNGGHANMPSPPCQWIEEVLVEAFGLYGLRALVPLWEDTPPRTYMAGYHVHLATYAEDMLREHRIHRQERELPEDLSCWYAILAPQLEQATNLRGPAPRIFVPYVYEMFVNDPTLREDLGALNRWPERSSVPIQRYVKLWKESCRDIGSIGRLPDLLVDRLGLDKTG